MKITGFKSDNKKVNEGVVREFGKTRGECYIRVARANNSKFEQELRRLLEPYKNFRKSKINEDVINEATQKAMAKFILLEMVGFEDDKGDITGTVGAKIEDTYENRYKVLCSKDYSDFLDLVSAISTDADAFKVEQEEDDLGKSERGASGTGPGAKK